MRFVLRVWVAAQQAAGPDAARRACLLGSTKRAGDGAEVKAQRARLRGEGVLIGGKTLLATPFDDAVRHLQHADGDTIERLFDVRECDRQGRHVLRRRRVLLQIASGALKRMGAGD